MSFSNSVAREAIGVIANCDELIDSIFFSSFLFFVWKPVENPRESSSESLLIYACFISLSECLEFFQGEKSVFRQSMFVTVWRVWRERKRSVECILITVQHSVVRIVRGPNSVATRRTAKDRTCTRLPRPRIVLLCRKNESIVKGWNHRARPQPARFVLCLCLSLGCHSQL